MPKIVLAEYRFHEAFKIPKGMDLEDKSQVKGWWVKWSKLYIRLVDETLLTIQPVWDHGDCMGDYMTEPVEATIEDGEDYNVKKEEGEESDDEEEDYDAVVSGIICKECEAVLPPHTVREHLDVTSKILQCPHVASCDKTGCNGGRAYQIRDKTFCSPHCGNTHFGLSDDDEDYWSEDCDDECNDDNRCEECCHCNRTRPCECGECDVVGGTCEAQSKKYEEEGRGVCLHGTWIDRFCGACEWLKSQGL
jgi:hypothetical protein